MCESVLEPRSAERCERVIYYLNALYGGKVRRMARELQISHSLISRVTNMHQGPGSGLLDALGAVEVVNARWLMQGEGDPLLPANMGTLPVASVLLPGPPSQHKVLWSGERHPVAPQYERDTRYWYRLQRPAQESRSHDFLADAGDLLLVETARDHLDRAELVTRLVCVIVDTENGNQCLLGSIQVNDDGHLAAEFFDQTIKPRRLLTLEDIARRHTRRVGKKKNQTEPHEEAPKASPRVAEKGTQELDAKPFRRLPSKDVIVGVVLHAERRTLLRSPSP